MRFDIITIFPEAFNSYLSTSLLKRAQIKKLIKINLHNLRDYTTDSHKSVDDKPYGGGPGMVMMVEPIDKAVRKIKQREKKVQVILFSAKGKKFDQAVAQKLAKSDQLIFICGRYEGVDERVTKYIADHELSIGNFVLAGGELPALVVLEAVSRLIKGVLGKTDSLNEESFVCQNKKQKDRNDRGWYLEYPQYTRPEKYKKWPVPKILLSGHHQLIKEWRNKNSRQS